MTTGQTKKNTRKWRSVATLLALMLFMSALAQNAAPLHQYRNPVIGEDAADPTIIKGDDGHYYLFATGEKIYRSNNLVDWDYVGKTFGDNPRPTFVPNVKLYWAPCVTKQNGIYVLYFALSTWVA